MINVHISKYQDSAFAEIDERRPRKLLLHKKEINKLYNEMKQSGATLVATKMYFKGSLVKVEIGLAKGKKNHDKRQTIKERDLKREVERSIKKW